MVCSAAREYSAANIASAMSVPGSGMRQYVNTRWGYTLRYPIDGILSPADVNAASVKLLLQKDSYPLLIDGLPNPKRFSPAQWATKALRMTTSRSAAGPLLPLIAINTTVGGQPAYLLRYRQMGTVFQEVYIANGSALLRLRWPQESNPFVSVSAAPDSAYLGILDQLHFFPPSLAAPVSPPLQQKVDVITDIPPLTVPIFAQNGQSWSDEQLGSCIGLTIGRQGCAVTSKAMIAAFFAITVTIPVAQSSMGQTRQGMNPGILNDWYRWKGGFARDPVNGGYCLIWAGDRGEVPHLHLVSRLYNENANGYLDADKIKLVDDALRSGQPVMAAIHTTAVPQHFVVITGRHGNDYEVNDPWNGMHTTLQRGNPQLGGTAYVVDYLWFFQGQSYQRCAAPAALFPAPLTLVSQFDLSFRWQAPLCRGVDGYRLRVTTSENTQAGPWIVDQVIAGPTDHALVTIPQAYEFRTLFWSLTAHNPAGEGVTGGPWRFAVDRNATTPVALPPPTATPTPTPTPTVVPEPTSAPAAQTGIASYNIFLPRISR